MNKPIASALIVLASSLLFTFLFYKQSLGINLLFFELFLIIIIIFIQKEKIQSMLSYFVCFATIASAVSFVINYTSFAFAVNQLSFFIMTGVLIYPGAKSLMTSAQLARINFVLSMRFFFSDLGEINAGKSGLNLKSMAYRFKIIVVPLFIIFVFLSIYNISSPYFKDAYVEATNWIDGFLKRVDYRLVVTFGIGIILSIFTLVRIPTERYIDKDRNASPVLMRMRTGKKLSKPFGLKREMIASKFLLIVLNLLILIVNLLDIAHVWFNFEWNGSYLKQFVHEGTYLLIVSIFTSMGIALYFFRGNINFYQKSKFLKVLAIIWMIQNAVLAVSVGIRNLWYIHYFALAYKRIGVLFFLLLTFYGIYTIIIKINNRKSVFYLLRNNIMALFVVLISIAMINWDNFIAKYNFSHFRTAFIHYDFLSSFPGKSLPYLDKSAEELDQMDVYQQKLFKFNMSFMTKEQYLDMIKLKKTKFKKEWELKSFLSWNYAEQDAYIKLSQ